MAAANILDVDVATGTASSEVVLNAGDIAVFALRPSSTASQNVPPSSTADIQIKTSDGGWVNLGVRMDVLNTTQLVSGPGTYRVVRRDTSGAGFGVDRN